MFRFIQILAFLVLIGVCSCKRERAREGDSCTPKWAKTCGDRILLSETVTELSEGEYGPNVCRTDRVYSTMKHSYSYKRECFFFFCYLHCEESEECNGEAVNVTKSEVDCCEGFGVDPTQSNFGGRDKSRYRRHGSTRFSLKKSNGCPIMLRDSVLDCLVDLGLTSLLAEVGNTPELLASLSDMDNDFTVFGPTNEAFDDLSDLDRPSSRDLLGGHIVNGTIFSSRLRGRRILTPFDEQFSLHVTTVFSNGTRDIYLNGANVVQSDACQARNGIVHVLSSVIPLSDETIADVLQSQSRFSIFSTLLNESNVIKFLDKNRKSRTVFAPTDAAFDKFPSGAVECLLRRENRKSLKQFVLIHIVSPTEYSSTLSQRSHVQTFTSFPNYWLVISTEGDTILVTRDQIPVEEADIPASNGVIHVLPDAILPFTFEELCPDIVSTTPEQPVDMTTTEAVTTPPSVPGVIPEISNDEPIDM